VIVRPRDPRRERAPARSAGEAEAKRATGRRGLSGPEHSISTRPVLLGFVVGGPAAEATSEMSLGRERRHYESQEIDEER
jgi:hypothetical protein